MFGGLQEYVYIFISHVETLRTKSGVQLIGYLDLLSSDNLKWFEMDNLRGRRGCSFTHVGWERNSLRASLVWMCCSWLLFLKSTHHEVDYLNMASKSSTTFISIIKKKVTYVLWNIFFDTNLKECLIYSPSQLVMRGWWRHWCFNHSSDANWINWINNLKR